VPIKAVLSDRVVEEGGDRPVQVQVEVSYQSQRLPRTEKHSGVGVCYGPGAIDWGQGPAQAAAFVTPRDPVVDGLAQRAVRSLDPGVAEDLPTRNIRYAAAIFEALGAVGVSYVPDPHNPYSAISETPRAVDTIHYPRETLGRRSGDCDDTSVLMASLLANVGVRTQLVDVPGHLFLLIDTGIHERNRLALAVDEGLSVVVGDAVWIPVETTALGEGFAEAWRLGADAYASWAGRGQIEHVDVTAAQRVYAPADLAEPVPAPVVDEGLVRDLVSRDADAFRGWRDAYVAERYSGVREDVAASPGALNELAHVYFLGGDLEEARSALERILEEDPNSALAHNNIAATYAAAGDQDSALEHYLAAVDADPEDPGIWLNLGILRYAVGEPEAAESALSQGLARSQGFEEACHLLGLTVADGDSRAEAEQLTSEEIRALLADVLRALPAAELTVSAEDSTAVEPAAPAEALEAEVPSRPIKLRVAGSRAADRMELSDHLYWKREESR
jgi:tetratricopeptide (TPR) repeat protein